MRQLLLACLLAPLFTTSAFAGTDGCDLARVYLTKGPSYYQKAIDICPGFIRPYELLGNDYRTKGDARRAIELFTKAAELGSRNNKLYFLLAELFQQQGDNAGAAHYLSRSLELRPNYAKAVQLRERLNGDEDIVGPTITLLEPAQGSIIPHTPGQPMVTVRGRVIDQSGVRSLKVNGRSVTIGENGRFLANVSTSTPSFDIEATDTKNNSSRLTVSLQMARDVPMSAHRKQFYRKKHAVVVGVNNYDKWPPLEFAVKDAKDVRDALSRLGFDSVTLITDKQATQRRLLTVLGHELPKQASSDDLVVFYFAGHGQSESLARGDKKGYIIPVDADVSNYFATAISMEQVRELSSRIPAKHILYVMDSCYSGLGLSRALTPVSPNDRDYLRKVASMRSVQILTAGGAGEQVTELNGHGLFTAYFLRGLEGAADVNKDGVVTVTELGEFVRPNVTKASLKAQTPLYGRLEGEGEVLFPLK